MSDETQKAVRECSQCGQDIVPPATRCGAHPESPTQPKHYTLSELRSMSNEERERVTHGDRSSGSGPKIVSLPGSGGPGGS